jgi:hypothetical protein
MLKYRSAALIITVILLAGCVSRSSPGRPVETLPLDDLEMTFSLPEGGWVFSQKAPDALVRQMIDHLRKEAVSSGAELNDRQLEKVARERLAINEGFVFNPQSDAYLMIDFRPLATGEAIPDKNGLLGSAYGAELALKSETGVDEVASKIRRMRIPGSLLAYRIDIRFRREGNPRQFSGIIGCTASHRFYLYYNDPLHNPRNAEQMDRLFDSVTIRPETR